MMCEETQSHESVGVFQLFVAALSVYCLVVLSCEAMLHPSTAALDILDRIDDVVCLVFIYDFFHRLVAAPCKRDFLKWGWIDLVSSIPIFPAMRIGRAVRVVRVLRVLRGARSINTIYRVFSANKARGTLASALFFALLLVTFSSIAVLQVETASTANIKTPDDALWWAAATITTVGYGDHYPVSTEGRLIGLTLMIAGGGLFSILTGFVATKFIGSDNKGKSKSSDSLESEVRQLASEVRELKELLQRQNA